MCPCSIGLGTLLSGARIVSDGMLQAAAEWYFFSHILSELLAIVICLASREVTRDLNVEPLKEFVPLIIFALMKQLSIT